MTLRFETATMVGQRCILLYMIPWLKNVELVDINATSEVEHKSSYDSDVDDNGLVEADHLMKPISLQGEGWGNVHASHMVLNNLFYLTVKVNVFSTVNVYYSLPEWHSQLRPGPSGS